MRFARTFAELLHVGMGLMAAAAITAAAMWAYPLGRDVIWWCGAAATAVVVVMGAVSLCRVWTIERRRR